MVDSSKTSALYKSFTYLLSYLDTPILLWRKCRPKNLVFSDISFMAILAGDHS